MSYSHCIHTLYCWDIVITCVVSEILRSISAAHCSFSFFSEFKRLMDFKTYLGASHKQLFPFLSLQGSDRASETLASWDLLKALYKHSFLFPVLPIVLSPFSCQPTICCLQRQNIPSQNIHLCIILFIIRVQNILTLGSSAATPGSVARLLQYPEVCGHIRCSMRC